MNDLKPRHLAILATEYINSLSYYDYNGHGIISGDRNVDVIDLLKLDKNNQADCVYAKKLIEDDLVHYLKNKWAQMQNLGAL